MIELYRSDGTTATGKDATYVTDLFELLEMGVGTATKDRIFNVLRAICTPRLISRLNS